MAGTKLGGQRAAKTNMKKYGLDFYRKIGAKGGAASNTGGFFNNRELARLAGSRGGSISRRGPVKVKLVEKRNIFRRLLNGNTQLDRK